MSDLDNLEALKRMLEHRDEDEAKKTFEKEKKFISDATKVYLGGGNKTSGIQAYEPKEMIAFLSRPVSEVKGKMGGEWAEMSDDDFEAFAYKMRQKIQKSTSLINWES